MKSSKPEKNSTRRFKAVLFDLGNTLLYFNGNWDQVLPEGFAQLLHELRVSGVNIDEDSFIDRFSSRMLEYYVKRDTEYVEKTTASVLREFLIETGHQEVPDDVIRRALDAMYTVTQRYWIAEDDAQQVLYYLRERGYKLGLISNAADDDDVRTLVDKAEMRQYFDFVLTSAQVGIRKPDAKIFEIALARFDIASDEAVMVGDKLSADILGANNAGIFSVWVTRRVENMEEQQAEGVADPDAVIAELHELPGLLESE